MTFLGKGLVAAGMLTMLVGGAGVAEAAPGFATGNVNLRAGPGTNYPAVATLRAGDPVEIYGCITRFSWCDINWRGYRGWAAGSYLQVVYQNRRGSIGSYGGYIGIPFITFSIGNYWNDHYRSRPFFYNLDRYRDRRDDDRDHPGANNGPGAGNGPYIPGRGPGRNDGPGRNNGPTAGNGPGNGPGPNNGFVRGPTGNNGPVIGKGPGQGDGPRFTPRIGNGKQNGPDRCPPGQSNRDGACR